MAKSQWQAWGWGDKDTWGTEIIEGHVIEIDGAGRLHVIYCYVACVIPA